jgi:hypothetical protein
VEEGEVLKQDLFLGNRLTAGHPITHRARATSVRLYARPVSLCMPSAAAALVIWACVRSQRQCVLSLVEASSAKHRQKIRAQKTRALPPPTPASGMDSCAAPLGLYWQLPLWEQQDPTGRGSAAQSVTSAAHVRPTFLLGRGLLGLGYPLGRVVKRRHPLGWPAQIPSVPKQSARARVLMCAFSAFGSLSLPPWTPQEGGREQVKKRGGGWVGGWQAGFQ